MLLFKIVFKNDDDVQNVNYITLYSDFSKSSRKWVKFISSTVIVGRYRLPFLYCLHRDSIFEILYYKKNNIIFKSSNFSQE